MARTFLGSLSGLGSRTRVYLADDALEVDEIESYNGVRRRVLLDEVLLITLDRRRSTSYLVVMAVFALGFLALGAGLSLPARESQSASIFVGFAVVATPFVLLGLVHLLFGYDYVTVFGQRSTAQVRFSFRKGRARELFARLQARVAEVQAVSPPAAHVGAPAA